MTTAFAEDACIRERGQARHDVMRNSLSRLLVDYIIHFPKWHCPGADGMVLDDVLGDYPALAEAHIVPGETELYDRRPELGPQIASFFFLVNVDHRN